nr:transcription factor MYB44-like isoform X1 [Ipomoea batatas]
MEMAGSRDFTGGVRSEAKLKRLSYNTRYLETHRNNHRQSEAPAPSSFSDDGNVVFVGDRRRFSYLFEFLFVGIQRSSIVDKPPKSSRPYSQLPQVSPLAKVYMPPLPPRSFQFAAPPPPQMAEKPLFSPGLTTTTFVRRLKQFKMRLRRRCRRCVSAFGIGKIKLWGSKIDSL